MKDFAYRIAKACGLFRLSRRLFRKQLLVLCYHGFEVKDESRFMPGVFMREETFRRRMQLLADQGFPVLPLEDALARLKEGTLPANAIVITLDDGFHSIRTVGYPILRAFGFPSTLYATSYYSLKGVPIFRLAVQYIFWKTTVRTFRCENAVLGISGVFDLTDQETRHTVCWQIINHGEALDSEERRQQICAALGDLLKVDYAAIRDCRMFDLMTPEELKELDSAGMDVQLHTHRHRMPVGDPAAVVREIKDNKDLLDKWLNKKCHHFCYPSGQWAPEHFASLADLGVRSATTCDKGFNRRDTPELALYRAVDSDTLSDIAFEAEVNGFSELLRILAGRRLRSVRQRRLDLLPDTREAALERNV